MNKVYKKMENDTNIPGSIPSVFGAFRGANIVMPLITTLLKENVEKLTVNFFLIMLRPTCFL